MLAIVIGFLAAWTFTRTNLPGVFWLERLMQLPYYMTPLVGALAWSILAAPNTGFLNQLWHAVRRLVAICSTRIRRGASPGSWRCSRAPSRS